MKHDTIKKLQKLPEFKEVVLFIAEEANKLNSLDGLNRIESITERAYEVTARLRAHDTLKDILRPLVNVEQEINRTNKEEYVV